MHLLASPSPGIVLCTKAAIKKKFTDILKTSTCNNFLKTLPTHIDTLLHIFKELSGFSRSYCLYQVVRMSIPAYVFFTEVEYLPKYFRKKN